MWIWKSREGELWESVDGVESLVCSGYSGAVGFTNDPDQEKIRSKGPIPRGKWEIGSVIAKHSRLGPTVIRLAPEGWDPYGRSGFLIHADSIKNPGGASEGCIILPKAARDRIAASSVKTLEVR